MGCHDEMLKLQERIEKMQSQWAAVQAVKPENLDVLMRKMIEEAPSPLKTYQI